MKGLLPMRFRTRSLAALALIASLAGSPAPAAPVSRQDAQPGTVFRRTALVVRDMTPSLAFYRDALGLVVTDDRTKRTPVDAATDAEAASVLRMVLLRSTDDYVGELELIQFVKPARAPLPELAEHQRSPGSFVLMFATRNMTDSVRKAVAVPGVRVDEAPHKYTYPAYKGGGTTTDIVGILRDPDANFIELIEPSAGLP